VLEIITGANTLLKLIKNKSHQGHRTLETNLQKIEGNKEFINFINKFKDWLLIEALLKNLILDNQP